MKVISKITEIYKIKSISNISKIDLVLKFLSPRFQIYKKFQKWTFPLTDINHSKFKDEIKYMSFVWRENACSVRLSILTLSLLCKKLLVTVLSQTVLQSIVAGMNYCVIPGQTARILMKPMDSGSNTGTSRLR